MGVEQQSSKLVSQARLCELIEQWASYTSSDPFAADTVDALRELQGLRAHETTCDHAGSVAWDNGDGITRFRCPRCKHEGTADIPHELLDVNAICDQRDRLLGLVIVAEHLLDTAPLHHAGKGYEEWRDARERFRAERRTGQETPAHPDPTGQTRESPHCPSCSCVTWAREELPGGGVKCTASLPPEPGERTGQETTVPPPTKLHEAWCGWRDTGRCNCGAQPWKCPKCQQLNSAGSRTCGRCEDQ